MSYVKISKSDPLGSTLYVDPLLTNMSIGYHNNEFIASKLSPTILAPSPTGKYVNYDQSHWFRDAMQKRAPGTASPRTGWKLSMSSFTTEEYSLGHEIPDEFRAMQQSPINVDSDAVKFLQDKAQLKREIDWAANFMTTSVWGSDKTGGSDFTVFSDYGSSTPTVVFAEYADTIQQRIGRAPNTLVMGAQPWRYLRFHPDVIDAMKVTELRKASLDLFGDLIDMPRIFVGKAFYTTTAEGVAEASATYTNIWGNKALLMYVPESASLNEPAATYTFVWSPGSGAGAPDGAEIFFRRFREEARRVDVIEASTYFKQIVTGSRAGLFMNTVT